MYRYDSSFAFPTEDSTGAISDISAYDVELLICNASAGKKCLYDIVGIRKNTANAIDLLKVETRKGDHMAVSRDSVFNSSISASDPKSNIKFSLKADSEREQNSSVAPTRTAPGKRSQRCR